jgi:hypothetical protein
MTDKPGASPVADEEQERDENDPGEVATRFTTKGTGRSGRDKPEDSDPSA